MIEYLTFEFHKLDEQRAALANSVAEQVIRKASFHRSDPKVPTLSVLCSTQEAPRCRIQHEILAVAARDTVRLANVL